ncbi:unnamed protein product [Cuscuta europaea]|uniref:Beta-carotene isomerase D27-like C-terminal domain-containing protein n=2 Tax=Cuscuta europaea TaxID=41803 RepID=A0A9P1EJZ0_CUSEU|nr:unnamed protein product [Cuscuta europaea]
MQLAMSIVRPTPLAFPHPPVTILRHTTFRVSCSSSTPSQPLQADARDSAQRTSYKPGPLDNLFLHLFRRKMARESGWDSEKPGYDGLIEVANRLMIGRTNSETREIAVRILESLFPAWLLDLYRRLIAPVGGGKIAAVMVARVTALSCQWLMGPCKVNSVDLPDGSSWMSGVLVEKCKYLEESKCVGICVNTCKLPTQAFFKDSMGVPLVMEPKFSDYSCQFKFGILPPEPEDDEALKQTCLEICPNASLRRKEPARQKANTDADAFKCPKA